MVSSFYSGGSGNIVQYLAVGGTETTQITSKCSELETSDGLKVHIDCRAHRAMQLSMKNQKPKLDSYIYIYILTWFFVLKLLEQSSAHKSHVILSNFQALEPRFE